MTKVIKLKKNMGIIDNIKFTNELDNMRKNYNIKSIKYIASRGSNSFPNLCVINYDTKDGSKIIPVK
jgi:hypothetical protein